MLLADYYNLKEIPVRMGEEIDCYPKASDRKGWSRVDDKLKETIIKKAEGYLDYEFRALLMTDYLKFHTENTRNPYMDPYEERRDVLRTLAIAECIEYKGRFLGGVINALNCICEEISWVSPAHNWVNQRCGDETYIFPPKNGDMIDLSSSATGCDLAWVYYLLKSELDSVSPIICNNLAATLNEKIIIPYINNRKMWWRSITNNWNVSVNMGCMITASLILDDEVTLKTVLEEAIRSMDVFLSGIRADGFCDEGAGYWHSNVRIVKNLEWLSYMTYGHVDCSDLDSLKKLTHFIVDMYVGNNVLNTFSDSHLTYAGGGIAEYISGKYFSDESTCIIGARLGINGYAGFALDDDLYAMFKLTNVKNETKELLKKQIEFDYSNVYPVSQAAFFRENRDESGIYFVITGGKNNQSHNHNDIGNFVIFNDTKPVVIDAGIGDYIQKAFTAERYSIPFMNSKYHNVPYIGGIEQCGFCDCSARDAEFADDMASMDIADAYRDDSILKWVRSVQFDRASNELLFCEEYSFTEEKDITLHFMLCEEPVLKNDCAELSGGINLVYDGMTAMCEEVKNLDSTLKKEWGSIYRLSLCCRGKCGKIKYKFMKRK